MNSIHQNAFTDAKSILAGGVNSPVRSFKALGSTPVFMHRGQGCNIWDISGIRYTDYCASWGALLLGHAPPTVRRAAKQRIDLGSSFGAPCLEETELGKLIRDAMPSMERIRFVSSGTEAVMSALRLARAYTGRDLILKFDGCYHGHADHLLVTAGSGMAVSGQCQPGQASSQGIPKAFTNLTISVPYNNVEAVQAAFLAYPGQIAAIIVEPIAANMGLVLPVKGFLDYLRTISAAQGSLLIFDEVITGFRVAAGGAQGYFNITPDLTTLGKVIGGGFAVGAYGGKSEIMALLAPDGPVYQAGTLAGNPVTMAAGIATLRIIKRQNPYDRIADLGQELFNSLQPQLDHAHYALSQFAGMFTLFCCPEIPKDWQSASQADQAHFAAIFHYLLVHGIYTSPAQFETNFIGSTHRQKDIALLVNTLRAVCSP